MQNLGVPTVMETTIYTYPYYKYPLYIIIIIIIITIIIIVCIYRYIHVHTIYSYVHIFILFILFTNWFFYTTTIDLLFCSWPAHLCRLFGAFHRFALCQGLAQPSLVGSVGVLLVTVHVLMGSNKHQRFTNSSTYIDTNLECLRICLNLELSDTL